MAALHIKQGANNPPEVPEPSETARAAALASITTSKSFQASEPLRISPIVS